MKRARQRITEQRVRDILDMYFAGELYDFVARTYYNPMTQTTLYLVDVRYCDGRPLKEVRQVLNRTLRGWRVNVRRIYSAEAIADELYRLCTVEGWKLRRSKPNADDTPEVRRCMATLIRDDNLLFYP